MLCRKPYTNNGVAHGCGQCLPCRVKKQTLWAHRIELESMTHEHNCFVTLTYNPENVPVVSEGNPQSTLKPSDVTLWLKRLRGRLYPHRFRYFLVGEYGTKRERPHYHVCLFGVGGCHWGRTRRTAGNPAIGGGTPRADCCPFCRIIAETWSTPEGPIGFIEVGELNQKTSNYAARYVLKKMTGQDDKRLGGRHPEFTRMSLKNGGLGVNILPAVAATLKQLPNYDDAEDVPHALMHGRKQKPLGRYLRGKLRAALGKDEKTPQITLDKMETQMSPLREIAFHHSRSFSKTIADVNEQKALNQEARLKLYKSKDVM